MHRRYDEVLPNAEDVNVRELPLAGRIDRGEEVHRACFWIDYDRAEQMGHALEGSQADVARHTYGVPIDSCRHKTSADRVVDLSIDPMHGQHLRSVA